jgi:hypothetical protein
MKIEPTALAAGAEADAIQSRRREASAYGSAEKRISIIDQMVQLLGIATSSA